MGFARNRTRDLSGGLGNEPSGPVVKNKNWITFLTKWEGTGTFLFLDSIHFLTNFLISVSSDASTRNELILHIGINFYNSLLRTLPSHIPPLSQTISLSSSPSLSLPFFSSPTLSTYQSTFLTISYSNRQKCTPSLPLPSLSSLSKMRAQTWSASPMLEFFLRFERWKTLRRKKLEPVFVFGFLMKSLKSVSSEILV